MAFDEAKFESRLCRLVPTQEGIQTFSKYILHHKDYHQRIVQLWLKVFRAASPAGRLSLFYLLNDVAQTCHRAKAEVFKESFFPVLKEALQASRGDSENLPKFERTLAIWRSREVFPKEALSEMEAILAPANAPKAAAHVAADLPQSPKKQLTQEKERLLAEFKPEEMVADMESFQASEPKMLKSFALVGKVSNDYGSNFRAQLKDRQQCTTVLSEVDDAFVRVTDFVRDLEQHVKSRTKLVDSLEQAADFYQMQLEEANIVENAYATFGSRIQFVKRRLDVILNRFPPKDAPSPGALEDPFANGVEAALQKANKRVTKDEVGAVDMDLDTDERTGGGSSAIAPVFGGVETDGGLRIRSNQSFFGTALPGVGGSPVKGATGENAGVAGGPTTQRGSNTQWSSRRDRAPTPTLDEPTDAAGGGAMDFLSNLITASAQQQASAMNVASPVFSPSMFTSPPPPPPANTAGAVHGHMQQQAMYGQPAQLQPPTFDPNGGQRFQQQFSGSYPDFSGGAYGSMPRMHMGAARSPLQPPPFFGGTSPPFRHFATSVNASSSSSQEELDNIQPTFVVDSGPIRTDDYLGPAAARQSGANQQNLTVCTEQAPTANGSEKNGEETATVLRRERGLSTTLSKLVPAGIGGAIQQYVAPDDDAYAASFEYKVQQPQAFFAGKSTAPLLRTPQARSRFGPPVTSGDDGEEADGFEVPAQWSGPPQQQFGRPTGRGRGATRGFGGRPMAVMRRGARWPAM